MHTLHIIIFLLKKRTKGVNMPVKNIEAFMRRKKTKSVNMLVNDIENSLKALTF